MTDAEPIDLATLQQRLEALSTTFASTVPGLVGSMQNTVTMMQRMNDTMEQYLVSSVLVGNVPPRVPMFFLTTNSCPPLRLTAQTRRCATRRARATRNSW